MCVCLCLCVYIRVNKFKCQKCQLKRCVYVCVCCVYIRVNKQLITHHESHTLLSKVPFFSVTHTLTSGVQRNAHQLIAKLLLIMWHFFFTTRCQLSYYALENELLSFQYWSHIAAIIL